MAELLSGFAENIAASCNKWRCSGYPGENVLPGAVQELELGEMWFSWHPLQVNPEMKLRCLSSLCDSPSFWILIPGWLVGGECDLGLLWISWSDLALSWRDWGLGLQWIIIQKQTQRSLNLFTSRGLNHHHHYLGMEIKASHLSLNAICSSFIKWLFAPLPQKAIMRVRFHLGKNFCKLFVDMRGSFPECS